VLREYEVLRELSSIGRAPAVESYFSFDDDQFWVIPIELPKGRSLLADRLSRTPDETSILHTLKQAFIALAEVHGRGIIHRALTPDRVFLRDSGKVIFSDFF
jgi:serine/threonine protein kinase